MPVDIESIELDGEEEVWDLETEKHHAFLADSMPLADFTARLHAEQGP